LKEGFEMKGVRVFKAKKISPGKASGPALVSPGRLGLRGFADLEKGTFAGGMGDLEGVSFGKKVWIFPSSKGSTMWSMTLDLACRFGNAPAAMVNSKLDPFVTLGCILQNIPLVLVEDKSLFDQVKTGDLVTVDADGGEIRVLSEVKSISIDVAGGK
jgi:predicted aconitase with swiveling domain